MKMIRKILSFALCLSLLCGLAMSASAQEDLVLKSKSDRYNGIYATYTYNAKGWLLLETMSWGDVTEYEHYATGVPKKATTVNADGEVRKVQYFDDKGTITAIDEPDSDGVSRSWEYTNRYDQEGRLIEQDRRSVPENNGEREVFTYFDDGSYSREYTLYYVREGEILDHIHYTETYNAAGHMTARHQDLEYGYPVEYTYQETYDADGRLIAHSSRQYSEGSFDTRSTTVLTYDEMGSLLAEATFTQGEQERLCTTTVYSYNNFYDEFGRLIKAVRSCHLTQVDKNGTARPSFTADNWVTVYEYDREDRMIALREGRKEGEWMNVYTWTYDRWGNLQNYSMNGETLEEYIYAPLSQAQ